jgi:hypothetical protein
MAISLARPIVIATLLAGTLDILSAFFFAGLQGIGVLPVLRFVASGPFGDAVQPGGTGWPLVGLAVHYAIMACMAAAFMIAASRLPALVRNRLIAGLAYGALLWIVMYWIVRPLRWPDAPLPGTAWAIGTQLFSHCVLVGLPIAWVASRHFGKASAEQPRA